LLLLVHGYSDSEESGIVGDGVHVEISSAYRRMASL
jgi:hypothetical protein